jgi:hypothetical protein
MGFRFKLQRKPFDVLVALLEHPGQLVTRDALGQRISQSNTFVDCDHSLNIAINRFLEACHDIRYQAPAPFPKRRNRVGPSELSRATKERLFHRSSSTRPERMSQSFDFLIFKRRNPNSNRLFKRSHVRPTR